MIAKRHLGSAPIKEAIIEIRTIANENISILQAEPSLKILTDYSNIEHLKQMEHGFDLSPQGIKTTTLDKGIISLKIESNDHKYIAQFRLDRYSISRLEPYEDWETFRDEAFKLWNVYKNALKPMMVSRISTRFINLISLPMPMRDLDEYLTAPPAIPEALPQGLTSYLTRVAFKDDDINASAMLTQAMESVVDNKAPIILDIDVVKDVRCEIDDDSYYKDFENLRDFKNRIFFESITEKTAELFQ